MFQFSIRPFLIRHKSIKAANPTRSRYHEQMRGENGAQTLLIDADDTLWENNIYFERAIANFISFLDHREHSPEMVRMWLNHVERESFVKHAYHLPSFHHSRFQPFTNLPSTPLPT